MLSSRINPSSSRRDWLVGLIIAALVALTHGLALRGGFIWDDDAHLTAHPSIVGPLGFADIWTSAEANYFPLTLTTWWGIHALFGLNPAVYHAATLLLHVCSALVLWRVLRRLHVRGAEFGALLWALHPVQVESVAWVSEMTNTQSTLCFLFAVLAWLRWQESADGVARKPTPSMGNGQYWAALGFGIAAVLSKPAAVMLPVALALCSWWVRRRAERSPAVGARFPWLALVPFLFVSAAISAWTIWEQKFHSNAAGAEWALSFGERFAIAGRAVGFYLGKLVWPYPLNFIYPRWDVRDFTVAAFVPAALVVGALARLAWSVSRSAGLPRGTQRRTAVEALFFAAAFFLAMLFPVLGFFDVFYFRYAFVSDHFQYLASIGAAALAGAGLAQLGCGWGPRTARVALAGALSLLSLAQSRMYESPERLYRTILARDPHCWMAHNNLALLLDGTPDRRAEAVRHFEAALAANPNFAEAHNNYGVRLVQEGHVGAGIAAFERAAQLDPLMLMAHRNAGRLLAQDPNRLLDAAAHLRAIVQLQPKSAEAHAEYAAVLAKLPERIDQAAAEYEAALALRADLFVAHFDYANLLFNRQKWAEAAAHYGAATQIEPTHARAWSNLSAALGRLGRTAEAIQAAERALTLDPNLADARRNLEVLRRR